MKTVLIVWLAIFAFKQVIDTKVERTETTAVLNVVQLFEQRMEDIGINCPEVVMAQIVLETNYLTSKIYRENNNLFGMKESRRNHDIGSQHGHALYPDAVASLRDYRDWQKMMGGDDIPTNEEYLYFLDHLPGKRRYAEDPNYTTKLKHIIKILHNN